MKKHPPSVTLVGPGRAGKAFARSWIAAGGRIVEVVAQTPAHAEEGAKAVGGGTPRGLEQASCDGEVLAIAVPDDAVQAVAAALAGRFQGRFAFHVSGALPAAVLQPLGSSGAGLASLHPARVFIGTSGEDWKGAFVAVEGDSVGVSEGTRIVEAVGGTPRRVFATAKPLYHAAAALAAGGTASLVSIATNLWQAAGIPVREARRALAELAGQAAAAAARQDFEAAFTGPVARRDLRTVASHADALASQPKLLALYAILASEILERTPGRGREDEVRSLLASPETRKGEKP